MHWTEDIHSFYFRPDLCRFGTDQRIVEGGQQAPTMTGWYSAAHQCDEDMLIERGLTGFTVCKKAGDPSGSPLQPKLPGYIAFVVRYLVRPSLVSGLEKS